MPLKNILYFFIFVFIFYMGQIFPSPGVWDKYVLGGLAYMHISSDPA